MIPVSARKKIALRAAGKTVGVQELAKLAGIPCQRVYRRYKSGWSGDEVVAWAEKERFGAPALWEPYTEEELYALWRRFRGGRNDAELLSDFMGGGKRPEARALIRKFRRRA